MPAPILFPDAPATMTGRGLHFTAAGYADVWQWKATSGGPTGWMDDDHFGPPLDPTPMQARNIVPYKGGFAPDPGDANYARQFRHRRLAIRQSAGRTASIAPGSRGNSRSDGQISTSIQIMARATARAGS